MDPFNTHYRAKSGDFLFIAAFDPVYSGFSKFNPPGWDSGADKEKPQDPVKISIAKAGVDVAVALSTQPESRIPNPMVKALGIEVDGLREGPAATHNTIQASDREHALTLKYVSL